MPIPKKKVGLRANKISFTNFSIIYAVELDQDVVFSDSMFGVISSPNNIGNKDLILKPTLFSNENKEVIYTPSNVIPHFYQSLYEGVKKNLIDEYEVERNFIYKVGDIVGYILV